MTEQRQTTTSTPTHDLPLWLPIFVVAIALAGGVAVIWWFMSAAAPRTVALVVATDSDGTGRGASARRPQEPLPQIEPPPTLITLKLESATPQHAVAELARASGFDLVLQGSGLTNPVSLELQDQPFWPVLMEICRQIGVYPQLSQERRITLGAAQAQRVDNPGHHTGPFFVQAMSLDRTVQADLLEESGPRVNLGLRLNILFEPRLGIHSFAPMIEVHEAVDDLGNSLMTNQPMFSSGSTPNWWHQARVSLNPGSSSGRRLARIRGTAVAIVGEGTAVMQIKDPLNAAGTTQVIDGIEVEFAGLQELRDGRYRAGFVIHGGSDDPRVAYRYANHANRISMIRLLDENGTPYDISGSGSGRGGRDQYSFNVWPVMPQNAGPPALLELSVPETIKQVRIPFEFSDLPLP